MLHTRAFKASVVWTLGLLYLGSVVHATESSLACPDWPTCFGSLAPEMTGGVFWEHLHRLVAGGLVLIFAAGTWYARTEAADRPWIFRTAAAGVALLLVQSLFGGLTVIYRLPDLVSTSHLSLAFLFLSLATVLAVGSHDRGAALDGFGASDAHKLRLYAGIAAGLVFVQSVLGALVRHTDGGLSCPDVPLCLGQVVPPLVNIQITSHFFHRVMALAATVAVVALVVWVLRNDLPGRVRSLAVAALALVVIQVGLGVAAVLTFLAVPPASLHTLGAASLLCVLVAMSTLGGLATSAAAKSTAPGRSTVSV